MPYALLLFAADPPAEGPGVPWWWNLLLPLAPGLVKLLSIPIGLLQTPLLTADQVVQLQSDNIVSDDAGRDKRTLAAFGIAPTPMDAILPSYLWRFRKNGQFDRQTA